MIVYYILFWLVLLQIYLQKPMLIWSQFIWVSSEYQSYHLVQELKKAS